MIEYTYLHSSPIRPDCSNSNEFLDKNKLIELIGC